MFSSDYKMAYYLSMFPRLLSSATLYRSCVSLRKSHRRVRSINAAVFSVELIDYIMRSNTCLLNISHTRNAKATFTSATLLYMCGIGTRSRGYTLRNPKHLPGPVRHRVGTRRFLLRRHSRYI